MNKGLEDKLWANCPFYVYRTDAERKISYANPILLSLFGETMEAVKGQSASAFINETLASKYERDEQQILRHGVIFSAIERIEHPNSGEVRLMEVLKLPTYGADGQINGIQGLFWDVTAQLEGESHELGYWNRLLMVNQIDDVLLIDDSGRILMGSDLDGDTLLEHVSEHERVLVLGHMKRAFSTREVVLFNVYTNHGDRFLLCRIVPCADVSDMQNVAIVYLVDVTRQIASQRYVEQEQRLSLVMQYNASFAHELNNIFTVLLCNASLLELEGEDQEIIEDILVATRRSQHLVGQMRQFVLSDMSRFEWLDVVEFFEARKLLFERMLGKQTALALTLPQLSGQIYLNVARFEQLIMSLLLKLQSQLKENNHLSLSVEVPCDYPPQVSIQISESVEDDDAEHASQVTLNDYKSGDLADLILADQVMRLFGGTFATRSTESGLHFTLSLPLNLPESSD